MFNPSSQTFNMSMRVSDFSDMLLMKYPELRDPEYEKCLIGLLRDCKIVSDAMVKDITTLPPVLKIRLETAFAESKNKAFSSRVSYMDDAKVVNIPTGRPLFVFESNYKLTAGMSVHDMVMEAMGFQKDDPLMTMLRDTVNSVLERPQAREFIDKCRLKMDEAGAIAYYTSDSRDFKREREECVYYALNKSLAQRRVSDQWQPFLFCLLTGLNKLPNYEGFVYRSFDTRLTTISKQYFDTNTIVWVAFTSTSESAGAAKGIVEVGNTTGNDRLKTLMKIRVNEGKKIEALSVYGNEGEVLLLPNTELVVEQVVKNELLDVFFPEKKTTPDCDYMFLTQKACEFGSMIVPNPFDAAYSGNLNNLKYWVSVHKDEINIVDTERGNSSLVYTAARAGRVEIVQYLIKMKANLNLTQAAGSTSLHAAAYYGHFEIVKALVEAGIDTKVKNKWGKTAMEEVEDVLRFKQDKTLSQIYEYLKNSSTLQIYGART